MTYQHDTNDAPAASPYALRISALRAQADALGLTLQLGPGPGAAGDRWQLWSEGSNADGAPAPELVFDAPDGRDDAQLDCVRAFLAGALAQRTLELARQTMRPRLMTRRHIDAATATGMYDLDDGGC